MKLRAVIISCYVELAPQGPDWAAVQILDILTFTGSDADRLTVIAFVFQHWVQSSSGQRISMNELLKH